MAIIFEVTYSIFYFLCKGYILTCDCTFAVLKTEVTLYSAMNKQYGAFMPSDKEHSFLYAILIFKETKIGFMIFVSSGMS